MEIFLKDLRYALAMLRRRPWFTVAAVLCLGLGLGLTSAIFSLVDAVLLRALPYEQPERIVVLWNRSLQEGIEQLPFSAREFLDLREGNRSLEQTAAVMPSIYGLTGDGPPERLTGMRVSASLFPALGASAALGRTFREEEDVFGSNKVLILSHDFWEKRFAADPAIVGKTVNIDREPFQVVGVMPERFTLLNAHPDVYVPIAFDQRKPLPRQARGLTVLGLLRPGFSREQAAADLNGVVHRYVTENPAAYPPSGWDLKLVPVRDEVLGNIRPVLLVLAGAVALVLLIACANVANLLLARATARAKEVTIRLALGAGRAGLIRQFLTESLLLSLFGAVFGLLLATWGIKTLVGLEPGNIPRLQEVGIDFRVVLFTFAVALVAAVLSGLLPALQASSTNLQGTLKEGGKTSASGGARGRLRSALVVAEVALAVVVLVGAGLVLQSFRRLMSTDAGFKSENLLTAQLLLPRQKYAEPAQNRAFFDNLVPRLAGLPGVKGAGVVSSVPLGSFQFTTGLSAEGREEAAAQLTVNRLVADPGYLKTLGIPLIKGRFLTDADRDNTEAVAVVDAGLAQRLWPGADPIGKRIRLDPPDPHAADGRSVVGVVATIRQQSLESPSQDQVYVPYRQYSSPYMGLVLRTSADPAAMAKSLRAAVGEVDRDQPLSEILTMEQVTRASVARSRVNALLFGLFAGVALVLAIVGVYGVMAYNVAQRTQEIGVRMSLGAQARDVLRMVIRQGLTLTGTGLLVGVLLTWGLLRLLASFVSGLLYETKAFDLGIFAEVLVLLFLLGLLASWLPARRATRVSPLMALRYE